MVSLFHDIVYQPIYNALALVIGIVPGGDMGIAIIVVTLLVRVILFPLSLASIRTQIVMREIDPELRRIRETHKDNREELARRTMALFKEKRVNPFAGFLFILIQLPIIIGLYMVLMSESAVVSFDSSLLYPFVVVPESASLMFLGVIDLAGKSLLLAALVGITQFLYARFMPTPPVSKSGTGTTPSFQDDFARSMHIQMRYVFPILMAGVAYFTSAAIALYFIVSNVFSIGQELLVRRIHGKR